MNTAGHRRLTFALLVICGLLGATIVAVLFGAGRGVHWHPEAAMSPLPLTASTRDIAAQPPQPVFTEVWQRPLFNPERRPQPESTSDVDTTIVLGEFELTGIILTADLRMALMRDAAGRTLRIREGTTLPDGSWTLNALKPRLAVFTNAGERIELGLKAAMRTEDANPVTNTQTREEDISENAARNNHIEAYKERARERRQQLAPLGKER